VLLLANEVAFRFVHLVGWLLVKALFRLDVEGSDRVRGPLILAPNHASFLDPVILQSATRKRVSYLMTETYWRIPVLNWLFRFFRTIPVQVSGPNRSALDRAVARLREGAVVAIFPEGSRSPDGRLLPARAGVALLASAARVPIVPVAILGTHRALPRGARFIRPVRVQVRFGEPIPPVEEAEGIPRRERHRAITARVMEQIGRLLDRPPPPREPATTPTA
jgi:1-acyl-sn-glycerol-3-phosphate acyltransferase